MSRGNAIGVFVYSRYEIGLYTCTISPCSACTGPYYYARRRGEDRVRGRAPRVRVARLRALRGDRISDVHVLCVGR